MSNQRRLRVVVADDSETFLASVLRWVSTREELEVVATARNGEDALRQVERTRPDLVLLDAVLPGRDGFRVTRALKARSSVPRVVIMTFYASETARDQAFAAGADAFLPKDEFTEGLDLLLDELTDGGGAPRSRRRPRTEDRP